MKTIFLSVAAFAFLAFSANAQTGNPNTTQTPQTVPPNVQDARRDSLIKMRDMESAQDKSRIREEQRGKLDTGRIAENPIIRDNTTLDNLSPDDAKRASEAQKTPGDQRPLMPPPAQQKPYDKDHQGYYKDHKVYKDSVGNKFYIENNRRVYIKGDEMAE